jgi:hypothetical protein
MMVRSILLAVVLCVAGMPAHARTQAAPNRAVATGLAALACAQAAGLPRAERLAVIDYSLPSSHKRLWVIELASGRTLFHERVAHGRGSGEARAVHFSNEDESHRTSLGLFRTLEAYDGRNGYSLRLDGLESGVNDRAYLRGIVMHGADYVSEGFLRSVGRLGRSHGCPAVRREVARPLIDSLREGQYLFAYAEDAAWLRRSPFLGCALTQPARAQARQTALKD